MEPANGYSSAKIGVHEKSLTLAHRACKWPSKSVHAYRNTVRIRGGPAAVIGEVLQNGGKQVTAGGNPVGRLLKD